MKVRGKPACSMSRAESASKQQGISSSSGPSRSSRRCLAEAFIVENHRSIRLTSRRPHSATPRTRSAPHGWCAAGIAECRHEPGKPGPLPSTMLAPPAGRHPAAARLTVLWAQSLDCMVVVRQARSRWCACANRRVSSRCRRTPTVPVFAHGVRTGRSRRAFRHLLTPRTEGGLTEIIAAFGRLSKHNQERAAESALG
jgi:hypothetical protein